MTVSYSGSFSSLLLRWKASVWKAVWKELLMWLLLYYSTRMFIQYAVSDDFMPWMKVLIGWFKQFTTELPIEFMLGFYVSQVITRWWAQVLSVPWPDDAMAMVNSVFPGDDQNSKLKRHTVARYLILTEILALRGVSTRVRQRFPTVQHLMQAGIMNTDEFELYRDTTCESARWQLPLQWAQNLIVPLVGIERGQVAPVLATALFNEFNKFREKLRLLFSYDWICVPLVYTQATGVGLYGYFGLCLIGRQYPEAQGDIYVPFLTILKFIFYVGWFKAAQDLLRPFGEDDEDIELNYILDRHTQVSMALADHVCGQSPPLFVDRFFESRHVWLPHTKLSAKIDDHPPNLHTHLRVRSADMLDLIDKIEDAEEAPTLDPTVALTSSTAMQKGGKTKGSKLQDKEERVLYF